MDELRWHTVMLRKNTEKSLKALVFLLSTYPIRYIADYFWGCSRKAGIDRYGIKIVESERFHVLKKWNCG